MGDVLAPIDIIKKFINEECRSGPKYRVLYGELYFTYKKYCIDNNYDFLPIIEFFRKMIIQLKYKSNKLGWRFLKGLEPITPVTIYDTYCLPTIIDEIEEFMSKTFIEDRLSQIKGNDVYDSYTNYCRLNNYQCLDYIDFFKKINKMQYIKKKINGEIYFYGIKFNN